MSEFVEVRTNKDRVLKVRRSDIVIVAYEGISETKEDGPNNFLVTMKGGAEYWTTRAVSNLPKNFSVIFKRKKLKPLNRS